MRTLNSLPNYDGFRMLADFHPHRRSWMLWPERTDIWAFGAKPAQKSVVEIASIISRFEPVTVGVSNRQYENARRRLPPAVRVTEISYNGCWIRDTGPTFVGDKNGRIRGVDWKFNAWGGIDSGLYYPWDLDDLLPQKILDIEDIDRYYCPTILEGGAIQVDGQGTALTTEECVLNPNRNSGMNKDELAECLRQFLGVTKIIWVKRGLLQDESGGHIDNLCVFIRPGEVVLAWTDNPDHTQYEIVHSAYDQLRNQTDAAGRRLKVHKLTLPDSICITREESESVDLVEGTVPRTEGTEMPASYVNFIFVNGGVIVPTFGDNKDGLALRTLAQLLPDREIVGVSTRQLLFGGGNVHCNVLHQPQGQSPDV